MRVEFFGVPRQRVGIAEVEVEAETLGQLLLTLSHELPSLREFIENGRLVESFSANLNGDRFVDDPETQLRPSDCVLILSADVGG